MGTWGANYPCLELTQPITAVYLKMQKTPAFKQVTVDHIITVVAAGAAIIFITGVRLCYNDKLGWIGPFPNNNKHCDNNC